MFGGLQHDALSLRQAKKSQGETNGRLDALIAAQWETNRLLALLIERTTGEPVPPPRR